MAHHVHTPADGPCGNCGDHTKCPFVYCTHCPSPDACADREAAKALSAPTPARPKPALGRHVHVLVDPRLNNGSDVAAAVIVRVFTEGPEHDTVNLRVFLDGTNLSHEWAPSRLLYGTEARARQRLMTMPASPGDGAYVSMVAFWPEGVR